MSQLHQKYPVDVFAFASPNYWKDREELGNVFVTLTKVLTSNLNIGSQYVEFHLIDNSYDYLSKLKPREAGGLAIFIPMSGGVQQWMKEISDNYDHVALVNSYLPNECLPEEIGNKLLSCNAHPACTDFHAYFNLKGKNSYWITDLSELRLIFQSWQAVKRVRNARLLLIGETEPWIINSCRDLDRFKEKLGVEIVPISSDMFLKEIRKAPQDLVEEAFNYWSKDNPELINIEKGAKYEACRIIPALEKLLTYYSADGVAVACFSLLNQTDSSCCLPLSYLNDTGAYIGACEGDLEAAVTMFLLKALGSEYVFMGNPIIYEDNRLDLVHCTTPVSIGSFKLHYRFMRHYESRKSIAINATMPKSRVFTISRIGNNLEDIMAAKAVTEESPKLHSCRTQVRLRIDSSKTFTDNLLGTHQIISYGAYTEQAAYCAKMLGLNLKIA